MPRRPGIPALPILAAAAALAACANPGVTVSRVDHASQYDPLEAGAAGGGDRQIPVRVFGNPFDISRSELEAAVIDSMQGRTLGVPINFSADPDNPDPSRPFRVVVAFDPEGIRDPGRLCPAGDGIVPAARTGPAPRAGGVLTLMGAFCSSDSYLSHALARARDVDGVDSKKFDALVAQLTLALFPGINPIRQFDGFIRRPGG